MKKYLLLTCDRFIKPDITQVMLCLCGTFLHDPSDHHFLKVEEVRREGYKLFGLCREVQDCIPSEEHKRLLFTCEPTMSQELLDLIKMSLCGAIVPDPDHGDDGVHYLRFIRITQEEQNMYGVYYKMTLQKEKPEQAR